ncbi:craniofacial development protein 1-like [Anopheles albimanus]|uniref:craniofacial development protein 1-like n=1 Tax=Anopheles albimanus TaxID=7167 RepID=UPI00163FECCA|nr:craniofacial development protein 1-like [Anopheles albimanus]
MNQEEYPSDSDASDEDFRPDKEDADSGSDPESEDDEPLEDERPETDTNGSSQRKRKAAKPASGTGKKSKASKTTLDQREAAKPEKDDDQSDSKEDKELDEEEEKRRTDALWADFLGGSSNSSTNETKSTTTSTTTKAPEANKTVPVSRKPVVPEPATKNPAENEKKLTVEKIFEFAGERVVVTEEEGGSQSIASKVSSPAASTASNVAKAPPIRGGGLGSVLNQIGKKNQLSTLEKTKLDWNRFKRQEGIEEELQTHNKGKDGFLERRDFLERTDVRQFEIEKSFRQSKRSNR